MEIDDLTFGPNCEMERTTISDYQKLDIYLLSVSYDGSANRTSLGSAFRYVEIKTFEVTIQNSFVVTKEF